MADEVTNISVVPCVVVTDRMWILGLFGVGACIDEARPCSLLVRVNEARQVAPVLLGIKGFFMRTITSGVHLERIIGTCSETEFPSVIKVKGGYVGIRFGESEYLRVKPCEFMTGSLLAVWTYFCGP